MSGLYLLALFGIWLFVGWVIYRIWEMFKREGMKWKILHLTIGVLLLSIWFGVPFWQFAGKKMYWDAKVRKWCAKDGGVKVYETVELTPDLIDKAGKIIIPWKKNAKSSDKYYVETEDYYFRRENPQIYRSEYRIIRRNDGKVLGELITYHRVGGEPLGPWHGSSFSCPDLRKITKFRSLVFLKGANK